MTFTDIIESEPHFFIAGRTGSGKSTLLNNFICSLVRSYSSGACNMYFIDLKRVELSLYKGLPHCKKYAKTSQEAVEVLEIVSQICETRYKQMEKAQERFFNGTRIYLFIDELADLLLAPERKQMEKLLQHLAQIGRAANIHLVLCTQIIRADTVKTTITGNINGRIALQTETATDSQKIINCSDAVNLPRHGYALLKNSDGLTRFSFPYMSENEVLQTVQNYQEKKTLKTFINKLFY